MGRPGICIECDEPVVLSPTGWYRCRACGYESLRMRPAYEVAVALYTHWCQFDAPDRVTDAQLRTVAQESIRQGDLFEQTWGDRP